MMAHAHRRSILTIIVIIFPLAIIVKAQTLSGLQPPLIMRTMTFPSQNELPSGNVKFNLFGNFGNNIIDSFKGNNAYLHLAAVASTYILVNEDVDYHVERFFNDHGEYGTLARPIVFSGEFLPIAAGGGLFAYAKIKNDKETLGASFAVLQASVIELLYNSTLKAITEKTES